MTNANESLAIASPVLRWGEQHPATTGGGDDSFAVDTGRGRLQVHEGDPPGAVPCPDESGGALACALRALRSGIDCCDTMVVRAVPG